MSNNIHRQIHPVESRKRKELAGASQPPASASSQQLLAGYMAYEFLTQGTLLGQELDSARAEAATLKRPKSVAEGELREQQKKKKSYAEVASLLKSDGAHLPWVVNPTQLARWVQM